MLNFPLWKVALISLMLLWGALLALPNLFSDGFLGIEPRDTGSLNPEDIAAFEAQMEAADASWWPGVLPNNKLNLGLDLRGGVYLLMEIDPAEVAQNRLQVFQGDVRNAWAPRGNREAILRDLNVSITGTRMTYTLKEPDRQMQEALSRLRRVNPNIGTTQSKVFSISEGANGTVVVSVSQGAQNALAADAQGKMIEIIRRRVDPDGVAEVAITPQGDTRIILEAPGEADPKRIKDILGQAGRLTFNMADLSPNAVRIAQERGINPPGKELVPSMEGGALLINTIPELTGSDIASANQCFDDANRPAVCFRLSGAAATKFYNL
ncbi:MAG: protein translocase subunit SecD, partial [Pseudomonadota bacterium]